jgi:hypothetical protein
VVLVPYWYWYKYNTPIATRSIAERLVVPISGLLAARSTGDDMTPMHVPDLDYV